MAETGNPTPASAEAAAAGASGSGPGRTPDEIALELMKFIAVSTGYGKGTQGGAGFSGKPSAKTPEEQTEALLDLFQKCRKAVKPES